MNPRGRESLLIAAGLSYLVGLSVLMTRTSYDIWGAFVLVPIYGVLGVFGLRAMFVGELRPIATVLSWGLLVKLGGAMARYWVGFEAYGGGIDAGEYHDIAVLKAGEIWAGERNVVEAFPTGSGTEFVEHFTSFAYVLTGGSQLAGFVTYSFLAYWGLAFMVKAAAIAVPEMAIRRYAWLCVLAPSIVYWPSSIGKEALMMLGLGVGTYGIALMLARHRWFSATIVIGVGLGFTALIRPHMSGIWLAAAVPALMLGILLGSRSLATSGRRKRGRRFGLVVILLVAGVSLGGIAFVTLEFLEPLNDDPTSSSFTQIIEETQRRTAQAGSSFVPPSVTSPTDWPFAAVRTLTRPLPNEARGVAQLVSAAEIAGLFALWALSWRRVVRLPLAIVTNPYIAFAMTTLFLAGLAFSSFANLGVLTRQKSLLFPFLLLIACIPSSLDRAARRSPPARESAIDDPDAIKPVAATESPAERRLVGTRPKLSSAERPTDAELAEFWRA